MTFKKDIIDKINPCPSTVDYFENTYNETFLSSENLNIFYDHIVSCNSCLLYSTIINSAQCGFKKHYKNRSDIKKYIETELPNNVLESMGHSCLNNLHKWFVEYIKTLMTSKDTHSSSLLILSEPKTHNIVTERISNLIRLISNTATFKTLVRPETLRLLSSISIQIESKDPISYNNQFTNSVFKTAISLNKSNIIQYYYYDHYLTNGNADKALNDIFNENSIKNYGPFQKHFILNKIGRMKFLQGDSINALLNYKKALNCDNLDYNLLAAIYINISLSLNKLSDHYQSLFYLKHALFLLNKIRKSSWNNNIYRSDDFFRNYLVNSKNSFRDSVYKDTLKAMLSELNTDEKNKS
jgi:tetratricopeptide (TPR) repeat protein